MNSDKNTESQDYRVPELKEAPEFTGQMHSFFT